MMKEKETGEQPVSVPQETRPDEEEKGSGKNGENNGNNGENNGEKDGKSDSNGENNSERESKKSRQRGEDASRKAVETRRKRALLNTLRFSGKVLKEIDRWKKRGITEAQCCKLVCLFLGDPSFLSPNRVYYMHELFSIAKKYHSGHTALLVNLLMKSHSFRFICNAEQTECYAFYSTLLQDESVLDDFEPGNEFTQIPVARPAAEVAQPATPPCIYTILDVITNTTMQNTNPPSEGPRLPGSGPSNSIHWDRKTDLLKQQKQAQPKPTYGTASEFFHTLKTDEQARRAILEPFRQRIMKRFRLNSREAGIVLARVVLDYLVPFFNTRKDFPTKAYPGRCAWLKALLNQKFMLTELEHAYANSQEDIQALRQQEIKAKQKALTAYRPLSPFEWTNLELNQRLYVDPRDNLVKDIPDNAPARPSASCRWNQFTKSWTEVK